MLYVTVHSVSEAGVLFFLMNVEDQCEQEDQQMIWGPIGGTGGLIHKFGSELQLK